MPVTKYSNILIPQVSGSWQSTCTHFKNTHGAKERPKDRTGKDSNCNALEGTSSGAIVLWHEPVLPSMTFLRGFSMHADAHKKVSRWFSPSLVFRRGTIEPAIFIYVKKWSAYLFFIRTSHLIYWIYSYCGSISVRSFSVRCFSISNSSVLSLIRSSRFEEYCSSIRNIESMMLVFFPLFISLNCKRIQF